MATGIKVLLGLAVAYYAVLGTATQVALRSPGATAAEASRTVLAHARHAPRPQR